MITIIGGGPVGCYLASLLADDFEVRVYEEHSRVGLPVQCTGIVTQGIYRFIPKKNDFVINQAENVRVFAPNNKHLKLRLGRPDLIINRTRFDEYFYNKARRKGVKFFFNHRFTSLTKAYVLLKDLKSRRIKKKEFSCLIGADGPLSSVANNTGLIKHREYFVGLQAVIKKKNNNIIDFYPSKQGFGWAVPENKNTLRVGVASRANPKECFKNLLKKYKGRILSKQGGLIPLFNPYSAFSKKNVFLVGDAAGFVKATTGGGIIPGLISAEILAYALKHNLSYNAGIYLHLYPSLWLHLKLRQLMNSFTSKDWNQLIKNLDNHQAKKVLGETSRDDLFKLLFSLLTRNPGIIKHGLKHLKALL
ncbi:MAG TPA: NAD(P)/FAD-dependent oxidoreductase [Candidatus Woesearchaeota archaeon]|nr:NAD(P)/FAD-dependent oxidoreductase [Candidatus Woesearchaeota archaeon]